MVCITYGYVIVFIIILILLSALINDTVATQIFGLVALVVVLYWFVGLVANGSCEKYLGIITSKMN